VRIGTRRHASTASGSERVSFARAATRSPPPAVLSSQKGNCAATTEAIAAQPFHPKSRRSVRKGCGDRACTRGSRLICIPDTGAFKNGSDARRSAMWDALSRTPAITCEGTCVALWFLLWWLSSTAGLRSGETRHVPEGACGCAARRPIISSECHPFLSGRSGGSADPPLAGLSAAAQSSGQIQTALPLPSDGASPHPSTSLCAGRCPLENRDGTCKIRSPPRPVKRYFRAFHPKRSPVDKGVPVEIRRHFSGVKTSGRRPPVEITLR